MNAMHEYAEQRRHALVAVLLAAAFVSSSCAQLAESSRAADADPQRLLAAIGKHSIVLLGEVHDNAAQHAVREQALRQWLEGGARPVLLMEQFDRERQGDLDRALAQPLSLIHI